MSQSSLSESPMLSPRTIGRFIYVIFKLAESESISSGGMAVLVPPPSPWADKHGAKRGVGGEGAEMGRFVLVFEEQSLGYPCRTLDPSHQPVLMEWNGFNTHPAPHRSQAPDRPARDDPPSTPQPSEPRVGLIFLSRMAEIWARGVGGGRRGRQQPADSRVPRFPLYSRVSSTGRNPSQVPDGASRQHSEGESGS